MNIKGIIGRKIMMHQLFTKSGEIIPVTYIEVVPNIVTQIKNSEKDGYQSLQIAVPSLKAKKTHKPQVKHLAKSNLKATKHCLEIRNMAGFNLGEKVDLSLFTPGEFVDITGLSKGKGTSGVIKRHHFGRGPMTHGSKHHRAPGSIGLSRPDKVWKGQPLPGRKGHVRTKIQNLEIVQVFVPENLLVVRGSVPGPIKNWLMITNPIKNKSPKKAIELVDYAENSAETKKDVVNQKEKKPQTTTETKPATPKKAEPIASETDSKTKTVVKETAKETPKEN